MCGSNDLRTNFEIINFPNFSLIMVFKLSSLNVRIVRRNGREEEDERKTFKQLLEVAVTNHYITVLDVVRRVCTQPDRRKK